MSQPKQSKLDTLLSSSRRAGEIDWGHYEWYASTYGSVSRDMDKNEWVARVKLPDGREARIKETFASANVAMAAVIRTWERENKKEKA